MTRFAALIAASSALSLLLSSLSIRASRRFRLYDLPTRRKQHLCPMPHLGGVAVFTSFWAVFGVAYATSSAIQSELSVSIWAIFAASLVVFLTGLLDDLKNLSHIHKIFGQLLAAFVIMWAGLTIPRFHIPFWGSIELGQFSHVVTAVWIVVLSNSINLIDGMDGLAGSVSITVCIGMFLTGLLLAVDSVQVITVCLAGAIAGFLVLNRPPARLFMGDSGSLFIGFMFSLLAVICPIKSYTAVAMFVPLVAVGLPLTEVVVTFIRRTVSGQRFYVADNRHIYNYLQEYGVSSGGTILLLCLVSLAFTAFIPALFWFDRKQVFSIFVVFILILFILFIVLKLRWSRGRQDGNRHSS